MQKHFAKPREIVKMPIEPHNHASKEESPLTEITHTKPLTPFLNLLKPSKPIAPTESPNRGDYAIQGEYQNRGQSPDPTNSKGHHKCISSTGPFYYLIISLFFVFTYYISIHNSMFWCLILWTSFLFKLDIFLFPLLTNSYVFFETCGFSYMTQTPCHTGGTTFSLFFNRLSHWGQCLAWLGGELRKKVFVNNAKLFW